MRMRATRIRNVDTLSIEFHTFLRLECLLDPDEADILQDTAIIVIIIMRDLTCGFGPGGSRTNHKNKPKLVLPTDGRKFSLFFFLSLSLSLSDPSVRPVDETRLITNDIQRRAVAAVISTLKIPRDHEITRILSSRKAPH